MRVQETVGFSEMPLLVRRPGRDSEGIWIQAPAFLDVQRVGSAPRCSEGAQGRAGKDGGPQSSRPFGID